MPVATSSISIVNTGGMGPFTYVWGTSPVQTAATATGLAGQLHPWCYRWRRLCVYFHRSNASTTGTMSPPVVLPFTNPVCSGTIHDDIATGAASYTWTAVLPMPWHLHQQPAAAPGKYLHSEWLNACNSSTNSSVVSLTINPNPKNYCCQFLPIGLHGLVY